MAIATGSCRIAVFCCALSAFRISPRTLLMVCTLPRSSPPTGRLLREPSPMNSYSCGSTSSSITCSTRALRYLRRFTRSAAAASSSSSSSSSSSPSSTEILPAPTPSDCSAAAAAAAAAVRPARASSSLPLSRKWKWSSTITTPRSMGSRSEAFSRAFSSNRLSTRW
ncbi:hypothetical protein DQ04_09541020 [Trypanosoma grayi]|uniref:hypothetical protein n=1 Tax=Trypanosoma grayi TaxID=71804 RepID=UPI0004F48434|nr:hypothetical protein DQ04_09541020 [Trypanosoma grayi]KEG07525.1 hypothetical protein DQ04_09541020 [Trypanosoma grayi]